MSHHFQKHKKRNYELIKQIIAQTMPAGSKDETLKAVLATYGISHKLLSEMLKDLLEAGYLTFDDESKVWKLPIE